MGVIRAIWLICACLLTPVAGFGGDKGPVTNLPMPRFVSMKADEGNVRRGPSLTHRVDWVFRHEDLPLQITAEYGHWRRVQDHEGQGGWMHYSLLSGVRTVVVLDQKAPLRVRPVGDAGISAYMERGVIARLGQCSELWCQISAGGAEGWIEKVRIWGVADDELRD